MNVRDYASRRLDSVRQGEVGTLLQRTGEVLGLCALVGLMTGLGVAGFERLTVNVVFEHLRRLPLAVQAAAPFVGLLMATALLRVGGSLTPSTADEYIRNYHEPEDLRLRPLGWRLAAAVATLGTGCPGGLEGPSSYLGAEIGTAVQARFRRTLGSATTKNLMVAGAAAGVAAVFKAPATGALFALEVPYRDDLGRHQLMPALVGGATGYLAFVAVNGTQPLFAVTGRAPFDLRDLLGALLLGIGTGVVIRVFAALLRRAKELQRSVPWFVTVPIAGAVLGGSVFLTHHLFGQELALGTGYDAIAWATRPAHSLTLIAVLLGVRCVGVAGSVAGGGVVGLFVPLVVAGALFGRFVGSAIGASNLYLFVVIGISSALGAGYRVPIAAVMFVAEATGRPGFVVPALIAAVAGDLVMGTASVSAYQTSGVHVNEYH